MLRKQHLFRPAQSREAYTQRSIERAFPTGHWVEEPQEGEAEAAEVPGCDPGGSGFESHTPLSPATVFVGVPPPGAQLPDGTPASPTDPKLKHSVQRTGLPAVLFTRKQDASKFASDLVREAKAQGADVDGNATAGWRITPPVGDPWGMKVFSRGKP